MLFFGEGRKRDGHTNKQTYIGGGVENMTNGRTDERMEEKRGHTYVHHTNGKLFSKVGYRKEQKHFKDKLDLKSLKQHYCTHGDF